MGFEIRRMDRIVEAIRKERRAIRTMGKIKKFIFDSAFRYDILNSRKMLPCQCAKQYSDNAEIINKNNRGNQINNSFKDCAVPRFFKFSSCLR